MTSRSWIIAGGGVYLLAAVFFFCQNRLQADEHVPFERLVEKENITDEVSRATLRAFYTAPPIIPHDVETQDAKDCLRCHAEVKRLEDGRVAQQTPHPHFSNCLQCHVPGRADGGEPVASDWQGLEEPQQGDRWFRTSPPTVPHRLFLRENCLSCHGPENPDMRLRTTHPERTNCLQCHVPDVDRQFQ